LADYDLILASASPRRTEILNQIGVRHSVFPADIDETPKKCESAIQYVQRMALEKAQHVIEKGEGKIPVMGADTAVVCDSKIFGKPQNQDDGIAMLSLLSGKSHQVITVVAMGSTNRCLSLTSVTEVRFREITAKEINRYWQTGEPQDKAGSYAIQGYGAVFVESIKGSYSGVVGLPIKETAQLLQAFNIPVWV